MVRSSTHSIDGVLGGAALAAMYATKHHYAVATAEELTWILRPTAALVATVTRTPFVLERHVGFTSVEQAVVIAPACAGVNFLIVAFATLVFGFMASLPNPAQKGLWVATSAVVAYAATVSVNALRIVCGITIHRSGLGTAWASAATIHRVIGTAIYLVSLWLVFLVTDASLRRVTRRAS